VPAFDTGAQPQPVERETAEAAAEPADERPSGADRQPGLATAEARPVEPTPVPAQSVTVPGRYHHLKWWQLVLVIVAVWIPAAAIGPGLFYWWTQDHSKHKTPVVFVVLVYVVVCTVGGLMLAMVPDRPLVSALAIAVMSAVFASVLAAAPFYGRFYCDHTVGSCLMGIIPY
jgi:hypothetical protein